MNLLALVTDAFGGSGGIAQYNRDLLAALSEAGDRVLVLTRQGHAGRPHCRPEYGSASRRGNIALRLPHCARRRDGNHLMRCFAAISIWRRSLPRLRPVTACRCGCNCTAPKPGDRCPGCDSGGRARRPGHRGQPLHTAPISGHLPYRPEPRARAAGHGREQQFAPGPKPDYLLDRQSARTPGAADGRPARRRRAREGTRPGARRPARARSADRLSGRRRRRRSPAPRRSGAAASGSPTGCDSPAWSPRKSWRITTGRRTSS